MRRSLHWAALIALALPWLSSCVSTGEPEHPNIVFILADDLGYGDISCNGADLIQTPNIDRIALEGRRFTQAYSPSSVCTPTRYALLTGRYGWRTYAQHKAVWINDPLLLDEDRFTLPRLLQKQGYETACIGKWHLGFGDPNASGFDPAMGLDLNGDLKPGPLETGFDYFWGVPHVGEDPRVLIENHRVIGLRSDDPLRMGPGGRPAISDYRNRGRGGQDFVMIGGESARYEHEDLGVQITEASLRWLDSRDRNKPFFLYLAHRNIHGPITPNARFAGRSKLGARGDFILELDWSVGEVLDWLDREGLAENTLVIFASDNGAVKSYQLAYDYISFGGHMANGPFRGQKTEAYDGGTHVPFLVRWPGVIPAGTQRETLIGLNDMLATLADFFDVDLPADAGEDSFSFLSAMLDLPLRQQVREDLIVDGVQGAFAIRRGEWKLILHPSGGGAQTTSVEADPAATPGQLFHLLQDAGEAANRYDEFPEIVEALEQRVQEYREAGRSAPVERRLPRAAETPGKG